MKNPNFHGNQAGLGSKIFNTPQMFCDEKVFGMAMVNYKLTHVV